MWPGQTLTGGRGDLSGGVMGGEGGGCGDRRKWDKVVLGKGGISPRFIQCWSVRKELYAGVVL